MNKTIANFLDLKVDVEKKASPDLLTHLTSNVLGTPGALRYKHTQTEEKLENLGDCYFLLLRKGSRMLGSVGLCYRKTVFAGRTYDSWNARYFAIKAPLKSSKPSSEKLLENSGRGSSLIRQFAAPYLHRPNEMLKNNPAGTEKSLLYAYIEKGNFQSMQFAVQNELETVRKLTTFLFNRFFPRKNKNVFKIQENEKDEVRKHLREFYSDHTLYMEEYLFFRDNYLVFKENGKIVAGMQANPDMWEIQEMPGFFGKILVNVFPYIPAINRVFNPRKFKFVAADYVFWLPGHENALSALFETACKINKRSLLMAWPDTDGKLLKTYDKYINQGLIGKMNQRVEVDIKVRFNGYEQEEKEGFFKHPAFISSFDLT
jgi:hypothetical protein